MPVLIHAFRQASGNEARFTSLLTVRKQGGERESALMHTFTPADTYRYERSIHRSVSAMMAAARNEPFDVPVEADLIFAFEGDPSEWPTGTEDGDIDNLNKAVFDALNKVAYTDDRLVVASRQVKLSSSTPYLGVRIRAATPETLEGFSLLQRCFIASGSFTAGTLSPAS